MDPQNEGAAPQPMAPSPTQARDEALTQRQMAELAAQNQYLFGAVQQITGWAQSQEQQRQEQLRRNREMAIAQLPPQDQARELAQLAREENQQLREYIANQSRHQQQQAQQQRQAAPQVADRNSAQLTPEQITQKKREVLAQINQHYGLVGDQMVGEADIPTAYHEGQDLFTMRAQEEAQRRQASDPSTESPDMAKKPQPSTPAKAAPSGANRPMAAQAVAPAQGVERDDFQRVLSSAHRGSGDKVVPPSQRIARLTTLREEAAAKLR